MIIEKLKPRGYCHGVVDAIKTIRSLTINDLKQPVYILGMLVHNKEVIKELTDKGFITLHDKSKTRNELLDQIQTKGTLILTAHGTADAVIKKAKDKGLDVIDTTCLDVRKTAKLIEEHLNDDYHILYIGKKGHPESEAVCQMDTKRVHLISSSDSIKALNLKTEKLLVTNQTTMSFYDVYRLTEELKQAYPHVKTVEEICDATKTRQEAVANQSRDIDHCFVVGDKLSNNSNNLVKISKEKAGINASLIETIKDLDIDLLKTLKKVSITSGASTPTKTTNQVIAFLEQFDQNNPSTWTK